MRILAFLAGLCFFSTALAQTEYSVCVTHIDKPEKQAYFNVGDRVMVFFNDTSEICGNIKSIGLSNLVVDSVSVPIRSVQTMVERNPKSAGFKLVGVAMITGGAALTAGGFALLALGLLPPSTASLYLVPAGLLADYFGIHFIIRGIDRLGGKGKQYDIGFRYTLKVVEK